MKHFGSLLVGCALLAALAGPSGAATYTRLTTSSGIDRHPAWTPDGQTIVYESDQGGVLHIFKIPAAGGAPVQLSTGAFNDRMPEVSPDGTTIVFTRELGGNSSSLFLMPIAGGAATQLTLPNNPFDLDWHGTYAPDGGTIYFSRRLGNDTSNWDIYKVPATGGPYSATLVYAGPGIQNRPHISRDGLKITFENDNLPGYLGSLNAIEAPLSSPAAQVQLTFFHANTASLEYSRDDQKLLFATRAVLGQFDLYELDLATSVQTRLTFDAGAFAYDPNNIDGAYSPDGKTVAFTSRRTTGQDDIWLLDLTNVTPPPPPPPGPFVQLTTSPAIDRHPAWTPDGQTIVYESSQNGALRIFRIPAAGGVPVQLSTGPGSDRMPEVSPDGTMIVFTRENGANGASLYLMPIAGGAATQLTLPNHPNDLDWHGTYAPDGATIYFSRRLGNDSSNWDIYQVPATGGPYAAVLVYGGPGIQNRPHISRDGLKITFEHDEMPGYEGSLNAVEAPLANTAALNQLTFFQANTASLEYTRDDTKLLFSTREVLGQFDMYELDLTSHAQTQLTFDAGVFPYDPNNIDGAYSPDGGTIAFTSRRYSGEDNIWLLHLERGPLYAGCITCPSSPLPDIHPGDSFTVTFQVCNCGSAADTFNWCVSDAAGWSAPACDAVLLQPAECRTVTAHLVAPNSVKVGVFDDISFHLTQSHTPAVTQDCVARVNVTAPPIGVTLSSFFATPSEGGLRIVWESVGDGAHSYFNLLRASAQSGPYLAMNTAPLLGDGHHEFLDASVIEDATYWYRVEAVDRQGHAEIAGQISAQATGLIPVAAALRSFPNPFLGATEIQLSLPASAMVRARIFDSQGRLVRTLQEGTPMAAGTHRLAWDGRSDAGYLVPAGIYMVRAEGADRPLTLRLLRVK